MRSLGRAIVWVAVVLAVIVGVARAVALRWWRIPADDPYLEASISPTLRGGDLVILWRLTDPLLSDLVVCPEPAAEDSRIVVGRIVAEGGDTVEIKDGKLSVNGRPMRTESACKERTFAGLDPESGNEVQQHCDVAEIGASTHMRGNLVSGTPPPNGLDATDINAEQVFLLSDNRQFPYDSRDFGAVDRASCRESIVFRLTSKEGFFDVDGRLSVVR
jgi:signal peptidase I